MFTVCCLQIWSVRVDRLSGGGVLALNQDRTATFSRYDGNSTGKDGNCNRQAVQIHNTQIVMEDW